MDRLFSMICRLIMTRKWFFYTILWLSRGNAYQFIRDKQDNLYMGRWWLIRERSWLPFAARLHYICAPDRDRHLHDHRSWYRTFILRGWYKEEIADSLVHVRCAGDSMHQPHGHFHRIVEVSNRGCWTIFVYGKHREDWGFLVDGEKVHWQEYLNINSREGM